MYARAIELSDYAFHGMTAGVVRGYRWNVLGYADNNQNIFPDRLPALEKGLNSAGVIAVRYIGGVFADADDWCGRGVDCTAVMGVTHPARTGSTMNQLGNMSSR